MMNYLVDYCYESINANVCRVEVSLAWLLAIKYGEWVNENGDLRTTKFCCFRSYYLEYMYFAIDPTCIGHYTWTVSEWTKDNPVSFGPRDMTRRFRDCLGRQISAL